MQEKKINTFHLRWLRCIFKIGWQQKITNEEVLRRTGLTGMSLSQRSTLLGHILRMCDERIPKPLLYSELVDDRRKRDRPTLCFKDVCKRDLKSLNVGTDKWDELANDRDKLRSSVYRSFKKRENQFFKRPK